MTEAEMDGWHYQLSGHEFDYEPRICARLGRGLQATTGGKNSIPRAVGFEKGLSHPGLYSLLRTTPGHEIPCSLLHPPGLILVHHLILPKW